MFLPYSLHATRRPACSFPWGTWRCRQPLTDTGSSELQQGLASCKAVLQHLVLGLPYQAGLPSMLCWPCNGRCDLTGGHLCERS